MGRGRRGNSKIASDARPPPREASSDAHASTLPPRKKQKREEYRHSINNDESRSAELPKKKWFRQRAHANPFSDHHLSYPVSPDQMDWSKHYPAFAVPEPEIETPKHGESQPVEEETSVSKPRSLMKNVEIVDIGCGYGGLLFALGPKLPDTLIIGLEIRTSITEFVDSKIRALRHQSAAIASEPSRADQPDPSSPPAQALALSSTDTTTIAPVPAPGNYQNISTHRTNSMKFLPNFFPRGSLSAIFLCFPDPHFKSRKHKARIVSRTLNSEYAFALRPGGVVYTITDVEELGGWMRERFDAHPSFARVVVGVEEKSEGVDGGRVWNEEPAVDGSDEVEEQRREVDDLVKLMRNSTEEGKKVDRFGGKKFVGVWRRRRDPAWPGEGNQS